MKSKKLRIVVLKDGRIVIDNLPVKKGQQVEVTVQIPDPVRPSMPLRGLPVRLIDPFLPAVPETDWESDR